MDNTPNDVHNSSNDLLIPRAVMNSALIKRKLNICHINVQSLCARKFSKFEELRKTFEGSSVDVICMTETWLDNSVSDQMICINGFRLVRIDRNRRGGGIGVYIRRDLFYRVLSKLTIIDSPESMPQTEYLVLEIGVGSHRLLLAVYYNPPETNCADILAKHITDYSLNYTSSFFIGDFNTDPRKPTRRAMAFNDVLCNMSFAVVNSEPTFFFNNGCSLLDLLISNSPTLVLRFNQVSMPGISNHDLIFASLDFDREYHEDGYWFRDYYNFDSDMLRTHFLSPDWDDFLQINDPDVLLHVLNSRLVDLHDRFFPLKFRKSRKNPWFSGHIEKAMIERDLAYRNWKRTKCSQHKAQYHRLRNRVNFLVSKAKCEYDRNKINLNLPSKQLWNNVRSLGVSDKQAVSEISVHSPEAINNYFCSNFSLDEDDGLCVRGVSPGFEFRAVHGYEIINAIFSIKSNAIGLDNIPLRFLKIIIPYAIPFYEHLFNRIISTEKFPADWKCAKIVPLPKKLGSDAITNLRPISLLSSTSKVFESLIRDQISEFIDRMNFLSPFQSGFRKRHSTDSALMRVHDDVARTVDGNGVALLLLIDFAKAFDSVVHRKLVNKLSSIFRFSSSAANLIKNYLCNRSQAVFANGIMSSFQPIRSGVPQGSVLGPLLFSLFINDLPAVLDFCSVHLFADDVQVYLCSNGEIDIRSMANKINHDLNKITQWSRKNSLPVNPQKTKAMLLSRLRCPPNIPALVFDGVQVQFVDRMVNLGVVFKSNLEWDGHINSQCSKIYYSLKRLNITTRHLDIETKKRLFKTLLMPHFTYGDFIYTNATIGSLDRLRVALNACVRYVYNLSRFSHVSHLQASLLGCPFIKFYKFRSCMTLFKIIKTKTPDFLFSKLTPFRGTRTRNFRIPNHSSSYYSQSFFVRGVVSFNSLPNNIKSIEATTHFRDELRSYLQ